MSDPLPRDATLPLPLARHVDAVCWRFEAAWKAAAGGERPRLEAYLDGVTGPAHAALLFGLLRVEAHHRRRAGEEPRAADYRDRLPDLDSGWLDEVLALDAAPPAGPSLPP